MALDKKYESFCCSVCLWYIEVFHWNWTFPKIILSHNILSYSSFCPIICTRVWPCCSKQTLLNVEILKFYKVLKNTLSNNFLWFNSFHVSRQTPQTFKIVFLSLVMGRLNISLKFRNFWCFLTHIFLSWNSSCVLAFCKNIQIRVPKSVLATVKYFFVSSKFWMFRKMILSHIFIS